VGGRTRTEALRLLAAYLVSHVKGVTAVENAIVSDDMVQRAVADALAADPLTAPHCLQIAVRYGEVRLLGEVTSLDASERAALIARSVPVVLGVTNEVSVVRMANADQASGRLAAAT